MRDILFKAKTTPKEKGVFNNVWVYGDLIESNGKYYIHPKANTVSVNGELGKIIVMHEVIPDTICQCTGLTDKNGNKIWDNDVVRNEYERNGFQTLKVYYSKEKAKYVLMNAYKMFTDFDKLLGQLEVIGNIFDNPELVKE